MDFIGWLLLVLYLIGAAVIFLLLRFGDAWKGKNTDWLAAILISLAWPVVLLALGVTGIVRKARRGK